MKALYLIPTRGGSKGIPHKNIKPLNGKPLIYYTIDVARAFTSDENICVTTDDDEITKVVENYDLKVPFKRPDDLASDTAGSYEVIMNALDYYQAKGINYDAVVLLQPTSPFRNVEDVQKCIDLYSSDYDMVVSVKQASSNPYYDCFEPDSNGWLKPSKGDGSYQRRQDAPKVYEYNGAVYIMNVSALKKKNYNFFQKVGFVEMDEFSSIDLDTVLDWKFAELILSEGLVEYGRK